MSCVLLEDIVSLSKITRKGNKEVPFLSMSREEGFVVNDDKYNISGSTQESSKIAKYGQLVIGLHMDEGSIWVQNKVKEGAVSSAYDVLDVDLNVIDPNYMNYALHTSNCMQFYIGAGVGSTTRRCKVPWESLKTMPINVPSLKEQKESVDLIRRIESLKHEIQLSLKTINGVESGLFEEYVSKSSPVAIETIAELTFGKTPVSNTKSSTGVLTYISGASDFGEVFTEGNKKVDSAERIVDSDSVLISVRDPVGKVNITSEKCAIGRGVVGVTPKRDVATTSYVYLALKKKQNALNSVAYGIIKGIGPKEVKEITLDYVSINDQKKLSESFYEIERIRTVLQKMLFSVDVLYQKVLEERFGCSVVA